MTRNSTAVNLMTSTPTSAPATLNHFSSAAGLTRECLTFRLGSVEYAIDILTVQEIRAYENPTRIASAPAFAKGVLNLRGVIVPIIDLRVKLGLERADFDPLTVTIILTLPNGVVGAVVDSVSDVVELTAAQIKPTPDFNDGINSSFIDGLGTLDVDNERRMLVLVDIEKMMASTKTELVSHTLQ